jgi:serine/threonine protein kinase
MGRTAVKRLEYSQGKRQVDDPVFSDHGCCSKVSNAKQRFGVDLLLAALLSHAFPSYLPRLFHGSRLVHGDLSEYNVLVCPSRLVENRDEGFGPDDDDELQAVLIDFGQAVDWRHPTAMQLLERDLAKVRDFFIKKGVKTLALNLALEFVTAPEPDQEEDTTIDDDSKKVAAAASTNAAASGGQDTSTFPMNDPSAEFMPPATGDSWGQGADAFKGSSWPSDWPEGFDNGEKKG